MGDWIEMSSCETLTQATWKRASDAKVQISYLVVDNFYDDPYAVREAGLLAEYERRVGEVYYPGDNSVGSYEVDGLNELISGLVHEPVTRTPHTAHCRFRIATAGAESQASLRMHVDGANYWSGIVYLSLPEHCQGGTEFYRHKEMNSDRAPLYDSEVAEYGSQSCALFTQDMTRRDSNDASKWEHLFTVPMRFNRCVIFRPWFWHTSGISFGDRPENARLIQLFFFTLDKSRLPAARPAS